MLFKSFSIKSLKVFSLLIALLFVLSACAGSAIDDKKLTDNPNNNTDVSNGANPSKEPSGQDNDNNEPNESSETPKPDKSPEDILKNYSYAIIDHPIEDFELKDLDGNTVKLSDHKGKIVFLNFWATWCPPCKEEMPHMETFYNKYKDEDIAILAVNPTQVENQGSKDSKKAEEKVRKFIEKEGFTFPILLDSDDSVWSFYQQRGIPANYVIDTEGIIRYLKPGAFTSVEEMEAFADAIRAIK